MAKGFELRNNAVKRVRMESDSIAISMRKTSSCYTLREQKKPVVIGRKRHKQEDDWAYLATIGVVNGIHQVKEKPIQYARELYRKLIAETKTQITAFVGTINRKAQELSDHTNRNADEYVQVVNRPRRTILQKDIRKREKIVERSKKGLESEARRGDDDGCATGKVETSQELGELARNRADNEKSAQTKVVEHAIKALQCPLKKLTAGDSSCIAFASQ
jgi:hypothetical protein